MKHQYKIYIAGKVTGEDYQATAKKFADIEEKILSSGNLAVNPMRIIPPHLKEWAKAMKILIPKLAECDAIYLLPGWKDSKGARVEYCIANLLGFRLIDEAQLIKMIHQAKKAKLAYTNI